MSHEELIAEARAEAKGLAMSGSKRMTALLTNLADALEEAAKDTERLDYILPLLELADGDGNAVATRIGGALLLGLTGRAAIDAARAAR